MTAPGRLPYTPRDERSCPGSDTPDDHLVRIAILTSSLPPNPVGGAEQQAWSTARHLAARGHAVTVFARKILPEEPAFLEEAGVRWIRVRVPRARGLSFAGHILGFRRAWNRWSGAPDVILAYQTVISGVLGGTVRSRRTPLVTWVRSESEFELKRSTKFRHLTPWVLGRSSLVLTQSSAMREHLLAEHAEHGGRRTSDDLAERVRVLGNAVHVGPEPSFEGRSGIAYVGRFFAIKGVDVLIRALARMASPPPTLLCGEGPLQGELERQAASLPVTFAGRIPLAEVRNRIGGARILVSPSWSEGFPNAILEGMERGLAVVATRVGGIPDVARDGVEAILVEPGDAEAMAAALTRLTDSDAEWRAMAIAARARAKEYGWDAHLARLEEILAEAIERNRG